MADSSGSSDSITSSSADSQASSVTAPITSTQSSLPSSLASTLPASLPLSSNYVPEDPFWPRWPANGPVFLDTGACTCALQSAPDQNTTTQVWRCQGNATSYAYAGTSGKWFNAPITGILSSEIDDASNPPALGSALVYSNDTEALVPLVSVNPDPLSVYDQACTGVNETLFSTAYYKTTHELSQNRTPVDAAPCWREGALPIPIRNTSTWQVGGCGKGFFCS